MKPRNRDKLYIYNRDNKECFFCGKKLKFKQITLDHLLPLSKGGTNDIFNLVTSCKKCNKIKGNSILKGIDKIILELFMQAVKDNKIIGKGLNIDNNTLKEQLLEIDRIEDITDKFIFQSDNMRFYVKNNKVVKVVYLGGLK
ncbi:HNH endonuclease [Thermohalobacter berrensis]|uniref:HNH nuclease domain-containing protein n=1 Tax=Thermohalobacter berrensis TaxID=99594 RepID=A0A419T3T0_9FIRM|nr:HNH endonuclease [Thermohalobacter berrensis]RKD32105.1 hypothetical protein BET03_11590 [Thermohalobacter berrensis]